MKIIRSINNLKSIFKNPVVTIGVFDGVHLGHKRILSELIKRAKHLKGTSIVITFDPHPARILYRKEEPAPLLISLEHRIRLIAESGAEVLLLIRFNRNFARLNAEDFIKTILVGKLRVKEVLVGEDFVLGRDKKGSRSLRNELMTKYGIRVTEIPMAKKSGVIISSTRIRKLIIKGQIDQASTLLGRPVSILGTVKKGVKRGRILGYPTANIDPHHEAIPPSGVYAVLVRFNKKMLRGILNIGKRPTFYKYSEPTIEVNIFNFRHSIYNKDLQIEFIKKMRDEKRFSTRSTLIDQIKLDEKIARKTLHRKGYMIQSRIKVKQ